ncbi:hypothetical protein ZIOFF_048053 [Zingiber officinale]|uniref:Uncharacterized protein n=1 Tax=Zingiber officinale TaxID=94328 RepID=A0A8J5FZ25_ZINOF|nr:hypothetical protein ZIOFF_048053 [Zingiber officinale]
MNFQDWSLVKRIKETVRNLPPLELPQEDCFIVLETNGCPEGWGGICKCKKCKFDPKSSEKVCAYSSGKYSPIKSTIDVEIHACSLHPTPRKSLAYLATVGKRISQLPYLFVSLNGYGGREGKVWEGYFYYI